jgi:hypothetical protein
VSPALEIGTTNDLSEVCPAGMVALPKLNVAPVMVPFPSTLMVRAPSPPQLLAGQVVESPVQDPTKALILSWVQPLLPLVWPAGSVPQAAPVPLLAASNTELTYVSPGTVAKATWELDIVPQAVASVEE